MSTYVFDLDGTLCETFSNPDGHGMKYFEATPYPDRIEKVNKLWEEGHTIILKLQEDVEPRLIIMKGRLTNCVHGD